MNKAKKFCKKFSHMNSCVGILQPQDFVDYLEELVISGSIFKETTSAQFTSGEYYLTKYYFDDSTITVISDFRKIHTWFCT